MFMVCILYLNDYLQTMYNICIFLILKLLKLNQPMIHLSIKVGFISTLKRNFDKL